MTNPNETGPEFLSSALLLDENGIWRAVHHAKVAYPDEGNQTCFPIEEHSYWFAHRNACILASVARFAPSGVFLDVGGGNGFVSVALQNAGYDVVLLEPGIHGALHAKRRGINEVICSSLQDADLPDASVAAVGLFDVIEHISDDLAFLQLVHRVLKPQGRLYLTTPAYNWLWSGEDDFAQHFRRFTTSSLEKKLAICGFHELFASYIFALLPLPIFLLRTLPYFLFKKSARPDEEAAKDHELPGSLTGSIIQRTLQMELNRLRKGKTIPFGGSCLAVFEKNQDRVIE